MSDPTPRAGGYVVLISGAATLINGLWLDNQTIAIVGAVWFGAGMERVFNGIRKPRKRDHNYA